MYAKREMECDDKLLMAIIRGVTKPNLILESEKQSIEWSDLSEEKGTKHMRKIKKKKNVKAGNELNNLIYDINIDWNDLKIIS